MSNISELETSAISAPQHVAIIMDGNGRWAQQQGKKRVFGHKSGVESVRASVSAARKMGVKALTLFAFSSENWLRPEEEVSVLMELFMLVLNREVKRLHKNDIKFRVIGDVSRFSDKLQEKIRAAEQLTEHNQGMVLSVAANYGGRWDIAHAARKLAAQVQANEISTADINEELLHQHTSLADMPELDLLIRTGGDHRISNFLLWQAAYAEFYFTDTLWPDFNENEFNKAVDTFCQRERRFGQTGEQVKQQ
ncbi:polyprenyl diphosphate synthase [Thalassotalea euphylliae]|uniref:Ditrans,polycis-undecaprenyl-diphosphate synthase ((2E,6E)-farnesyl-diphosphate specific) n=1 Tax=Thalassotalea euphylliae TaxID=1655234 RepID=A0A3E0UGV7_9GAMM|nr:polyprenyl diphosphate synthase [Thalassotalea euphylliae]REL36129.1 di-trans,poly-cis-decaprenylcistransferase [Thalassotalea euphylliae]